MNGIKDAKDIPAPRKNLAPGLAMSAKYCTTPWMTKTLAKVAWNFMALGNVCWKLSTITEPDGKLILPI